MPKPDFTNDVTIDAAGVVTKELEAMAQETGHNIQWEIRNNSGQNLTVSIYWHDDNTYPDPTDSGDPPDHPIPDHSNLPGNVRKRYTRHVRNDADRGVYGYGLKFKKTDGTDFGTGDPWVIIF